MHLNYWCVLSQCSHEGGIQVEMWERSRWGPCGELLLAQEWSEEFAQAQELPLYSLWFSYVCCVRIAACYSSDTRMDSNSTYTYITNCPHINTHTHTHTHTHTQTNKYRGTHARNLTDKYPYTHGCAPSCMHMFG